MTEYQEYIGGEPAIYEAGGAQPIEPVPVIDLATRRTPEKVSCMTWPIPQSTVGTPVQILQRRLRRYKAKITIVSVNPVTTTVLFNSKLDPLQGSNPQGATYSPGTIVDSFLPDWETEQPCYCIAVGGTAVVTVQDEAYHG